MPCAFLRASHSCQYCGHFIPAWILPAALSAFHSAPQARSRAIMAWRPGEPVTGFAAGAGAAVAGAAGAGAAPTGAAAPDMHCLVKSRYFMPPVWFAAFIWSHWAAHSFKVLAEAAPGASATTPARVATKIKQRLFMTISSAEWQIPLVDSKGQTNLRGGGVGDAFLGEARLRGAVQLLRRRLVLAALLGEACERRAMKTFAGRLDFAAIFGKGRGHEAK